MLCIDCGVFFKNFLVVKNIDIEILSTMQEIIVTEKKCSDSNPYSIPWTNPYFMKIFELNNKLGNIFIADLLQAVDRTERRFKVHNHFNLGKLKIDIIKNVTS